MSVSSFSVLVTVLFLSFSYSTEGKGVSRNKIAELNDPLIRRSPVWCTLQYISCMEGHHSGERGRPYSPTQKGCEARLKRKYFCSERSMRRRITNEDRRKYFITSRGDLGVNTEADRSELQDTLQQNGTSIAEVAQVTSLVESSSSDGISINMLNVTANN